MNVTPYLFLDGRCEEAVQFYQSTLGATDVILMRYKDSPEPPRPGMVPPGSENKILHASFKIGATEVMASDGNVGGKPSFKGFSLSVSLRSDADAQRLFATLSAGGEVHMPLSKTFFSSSFGMLADRFGVPWMVIVAA